MWGGHEKTGNSRFEPEAVALQKHRIPILGWASHSVGRSGLLFELFGAQSQNNSQKEHNQKCGKNGIYAKAANTIRKTER